MPMNFETAPDDPHYVQLAAPLMQEIASGFNNWLVGVTVAGESGSDATRAVCMAFGTLLGLLATHCAKPGSEDEYRAVVLGLIEQNMKLAGPNANPN